MNTNLTQARTKFIQGMTQISQFWGFPKAMGAIYGAIYLSLQPINLDELVTQVGVSKGAVSTNVRKLERLKMVQKQVRIGDRKDYYVAETNFWKMVRSILQERQNRDFDQALQMVDESLKIVDGEENSGTAKFYRDRINKMQAFFRTLDNIVAAISALDELRISSLHKILGKKGD